MYSFTGCEICLYDLEQEVAVVTYETVAENLAGDEDGETTTTEFTNDLGMPPVINVVVVGGLFIWVTLRALSKTRAERAVGSTRA